MIHPYPHTMYLSMLSVVMLVPFRHPSSLNLCIHCLELFMSHTYTSASSEIANHATHSPTRNDKIINITVIAHSTWIWIGY